MKFSLTEILANGFGKDGGGEAEEEEGMGKGEAGLG